MASAEPVRLPFGFAAPTEKDLGETARRILEQADARMRSARTRALLYLLPSLAYYFVFSLGAALVFWGLNLRLEGGAFLLAVACAFLLTALLGQYYRMEAQAPSPEMPRILAMLILQAYVLKALTSVFFVFPYLVLRNLSRLFPRRPRVDAEVLTLAAHLAAALDIPVRDGEVLRLLPRNLPPAALGEAALLLEWAGALQAVPQGGDLLFFPGDDFAAGMAALLPPRNRRITFSDLMTSEGGIEAREVPEEDEEAEEPAGAPAPLKLPRWMGRPGEHPLRAAGIAVLALLILWTFFALGRAWYRRLPMDLRTAVLPLDEGVHSITPAGGTYYVGRQDTVDKAKTLDEWNPDKVRLNRLAQRRGRFGSETDSRDEIVAFREIYHAEPDPGGTYLLVYGTWACASGHSCAGTGLCVVNPAERTLRSVEQYGNAVVKGWWDAGRLLATRPAATWDRGGGSPISSDNLAGTLVAIHAASDESEILYQPREAYFALGGLEGGQRVFLAADITPDTFHTHSVVRFSEYRNFQKIRTFSITVNAFNPFLSQAKLDASGKYWILAFTYVPGLAEMEKGIQHSLWIVTRSGSRWREVTARDRCSACMLHPILFNGRNILTYICEESKSKLIIRELLVD